MMMARKRKLNAVKKREQTVMPAQKSVGVCSVAFLSKWFFSTMAYPRYAFNAGSAHVAQPTQWGLRRPMGPAGPVIASPVLSPRTLQPLAPYSFSAGQRGVQTQPSPHVVPAQQWHVVHATSPQHRSDWTSQLIQQSVAVVQPSASTHQQHMRPVYVPIDAPPPRQAAVFPLRELLANMQAQTFGEITTDSDGNLPAFTSPNVVEVENLFTASTSPPAVNGDDNTPDAQDGLIDTWPFSGHGDGQLDTVQMQQITTRSENDNKECEICQTEVSIRMSPAMF